MTTIEHMSTTGTLTISATVCWLENGREISFALVTAIAVESGQPLKVDWQHGSLQGKLRGEWQEGHLLLDVTCQHQNESPLRISAITWCIDHPSLHGDHLRAWGLPFSVWGHPGLAPLAQVDADHPQWWRSAVVAPDQDHALSACWRMPANGQDSIHYTDGVMTCTAFHDELLPGNSVFTSDTLAIACAAPVRHALAGPASFACARRQPSESTQHMAWNSWDFHRLTISANDIREELHALRAHPWLRDAIRYVVIDDGWHRGCGDWEANHRFPDGMAAIAAEIREAGFIPGIWSAPFLADRQSHIGLAHPEWFVQKDGKPYSPWADVGCTPPWGDRCYLDPTHPGVLTHIDALYRRLSDWGFQYFKTDFLANPLSDGLSATGPERKGNLTYHNRGAGLLRAHRHCMEAIRRAIGNDSFWLGCGSIWATGAGLMDASRMSADIQATWQATLSCADSVQWAGALHGAIWLNDPDFLIVRGPQTSLTLMANGDAADTFVMASHGGEPTFSEHEAQVWATCVAMSGGMVVASDGMHQLNKHGLAILKVAIECAGGSAAEPIDIDSERPGVLLKQIKSQAVLACVNWSDEPVVACPQHWIAHLPEQSWRDAWSGTCYTTRELSSYRIAPRSCLLLR